MGRQVSISTPTGTIGGWRADPAQPARGAIVLVQEIFGVNAHIRGVVERYAGAGFTTIAPALFDHIEAGVELGYDEAGVARGRELVAALGFERALQDVQAAASMLGGAGKVAVVGFCWGGTLAFLSNTRLGLPAVSWYGGRTMPFVQEPLRAPMQFHFGIHDALIPAGDRDAHRRHHPQAAIHEYDAGHGFNCDHRADFDAAASQAAMQRSVEFLARVLA